MWTVQEESTMTKIFGLLRFLLGVFIAFAVLYAFGMLTKKDRVQPGSPEHEAYIEKQVTLCFQESLADDLERSRREIPDMLTRSERLAFCRALVRDMDRLYPEGRPERKFSN